ncbi:unnamed protein product [Moneuplotes crassus]|uniref:Uncharacterized protein n=1 Tax=Euplotes crassus TaxID=5936 RepID=A0AAD1U4I1_EUPCR|nr:unnamed protein product [Moneuplotes crassus]
MEESRCFKGLEVGGVGNWGCEGSKCMKRRVEEELDDEEGGFWAVCGRSDRIWFFRYLEEVTSYLSCCKSYKLSREETNPKTPNCSSCCEGKLFY